VLFNKNIYYESIDCYAVQELKGRAAKTPQGF